MLLRRTRRTPAGFIQPCLPSPAERPPTGPGWIHEIKHGGFRMMVRRDAAGVRLLTRNGIDWSGRFPLIVQAVGALRARSCLIDGEAIAYDDDGLASFELLRGRVTTASWRYVRSISSNSTDVTSATRHGGAQTNTRAADWQT